MEADRRSLPNDNMTVFDKSDMDDVGHAIERLPTIYRSVMKLVLLGYTAEQVAAQLSTADKLISPETVRMRKKRAIKQIQVTLKLSK